MALDRSDINRFVTLIAWPYNSPCLSIDLLFLESSEVIFRFAIALLSIHKEELLKRDSFEDIMDYIKTSLPQISADILDKITRDVSI